ncbi:hypothetical protein DFH06DRAFT_1293732 [Mycena polygramma]|nr:hypothetical protein DFH06DRAFT_1293732 [Mycena polygramma]
MQFLAVLLAAASVAFAQTPSIVSSFGEANCTGAALATFSGLSEDSACFPTGAGQSLRIIRGTAQCGMTIYSTSNCDVPAGGFSETVPPTSGCFTSTVMFESVRIVCTD